MSIFTRATTISASNVTSITAEFDDTNALDSSYTLFAVLYVSGTASTITSNSWSATQLSGSGNNGSINYLGGYAVLGNGTRNSFTANFGESVSNAKIDLYAFPGSGTPILDGTGYGSSSSGSVSTVTYGPSVATTFANTISITAVSLIGGKGEWGTFSDSYTALPAATGNMISAVKAFTTAGQSPSPTMSWTSSRTARASIWNIQGVSAEVDVPFENIITMNLGNVRPISLNMGQEYVDRMYLGADLLQVEEDTTPPPVPVLANPVVNGTTVTLTSSTVTDTQSDLRYNFYRDGDLIGSPRTPSLTDEGLTPGTTYSYTVAAVDDFGNLSAQSAAKTATIAAVADTIAPSVPVLADPTADGTSVSLSWSASTDNVAVTAYRVYRSTTLIATVTSGLTFTDDGRTAGTTYTYSVAAVDAANNASAKSASKSITVPTAPPQSASAIYGPSGTFYPRDTPDIRTGNGYTIYPAASCSWSAVNTVLRALTASQIAAGAVISIPPGTLAAGTSDALDSYSNTATKRVLIVARDGWGSVTTASGTTFTNITGVVVMGIKYTTCQVKAGKNFGLAWSSMEGNYFSMNGTSSGAIVNCTLDELCHARDTILKNSDTSQMQSSNGNGITGVVIRGSYYGPTWMIDGDYDHGNEPNAADGDFPHTDSLQFAGNPIASDITFINTAIFASHTSGIISNGVTNMKFDKCFMVGGASRVTVAGRHPFLPGGGGYPGAKEGAGYQKTFLGTFVNAQAKDSIFIGSIAKGFTTVTNTKVSPTPTYNPTSGSWTSVPAMSSWVNSDYIAQGCPKPTTASLKEAWEYPKVV
jgi:chitodextrinase